jgi:predicted DCC family thiol-disulfide oxidoreductase YuxK
VEIQSDKILIVFDDLCFICNSAVRFLLKYDFKKKFVFTSFNSSYFIKNISQYSSDNDSVIVIHDKKIFQKSDAVMLLLKNMIFPFNLLSVFRIIPLNIRNIFYDFIARNRNKIFPKSNKCNLSLPKYSSQFYL